MGNRFEILDKVTSSDLQKYSGSTIEILIPAHNSENSIGKVIKNLSCQALPNNSKIHLTICANACKDNTVNAAKKAIVFASRRNKRFQATLISTDEPGEPQALNRMLKAVNSEIVIVVNDDVDPTKDSLINLYIAMKKNPDLCAIGVQSRPHLKCTGNNQPYAVRLANQISKIYTEKDILIVGRMYAFRPYLVKHFPNIMSEDNYLTYISLTNSKGYGIIKNNDTYVYYTPPTNFSDVVSQTLMYSLSGVQFLREYPKALDLFIAVQEKLERSGGGNSIENETREVRQLAQMIQDNCWNLASEIDKLEPIGGSLRSRIGSTVR